MKQEIGETSVLDFDEQSGTLYVSVESEYYRMMMADRFQKTLEQYLFGLLERPVSIQFSGKQENAGTKTQQGSEFIAASSTRYEEEVNPGLVVSFPSYRLRAYRQREIPAGEMSAVTSLSNNVYPEMKAIGGARKSVSKNIPYQEIIALANMPEVSYRRIIKKRDSLGGGLIERIGLEGQGTGNPHIDNAIRWRVHNGIVLTKRDAATIQRKLFVEVTTATTQEDGIQIALEVLYRMANTPVELWLDNEAARNAIVSDSQPTNLFVVLRQVLGIADIPAKLHEAAEHLLNHLRKVFGTTYIPQHFFRVVAPELGLQQNEMWGLLSLWDRCFVIHGDNIHEETDLIIAPKGDAQMAYWAGWSLRTWKRKRTDPILSTLIQEVEIETDKKADGYDEYWAKFAENGGVIYRLRKDMPPLWFEEEADGTLIQHWSKPSAGWDKVIGGFGQSDSYADIWTKRYAEMDKVIGL